MYKIFVITIILLFIRKNNTYIIQKVFVEKSYEFHKKINNENPIYNEVIHIKM